jgi:SAM-dependent methyltransferase
MIKKYPFISNNLNSAGVLRMDEGKWLSYNELAWIELVLSPPDKHTEETEYYCRLIKEAAGITPETILHLGSGAGIYDFTLKRHFKVTGVDISDGMLAASRKLNPEVEYIKGDMRTVRLNREFDAVIIPESIGYMTTVEDLRRAIVTGYGHLKRGGVLLITAHVREEFRENNFAYTGSKDNCEVTVFENNYIPDPEGSIYEATIIYLVRKEGELKIYTDRHLIGLFDTCTWLDLLTETGCNLRQFTLNDSYDPYILGEGEYLQKVFICIKPEGEIDRPF